MLVAFQFFTGDNMTDLFRAAHGGQPTDVSSAWTGIHIVVGVAILLAMLWRLALRRTRRRAAAAEAAPGARMARKARSMPGFMSTSSAPLVGLVAYFWLPVLGELHELMIRQILIVLFALHVVGALWHRFVVRDDVMTRMVRPAR